MRLEFFCSKLDISLKNFEVIMNEPPIKHSFYKKFTKKRKSIVHNFSHLKNILKYENMYN